MDLEERRTRIRQKMRDGELVSNVTRQFSVCAGPGQGPPCSVCGRVLGARDTEFEFSSGVRLDVQCFTVWLEELGRG
ncbi:MAG: hypothetical protein HYU51_18375 [Candidatus Rokubacteria bacterium]|nr:hypothetical protein [Candidatus Rokubacteria bacterium]